MGSRLKNASPIAGMKRPDRLPPWLDSRLVAHWPDAQWQEVHRLRHQFPDTNRAYEHDAADVTFSNAASAIRLAVWREEPFTLPAAEDVEWAQRVVRNGRAIVYTAAATVRHSHQ